jgi:hypothetical protein
MQQMAPYPVLMHHCGVACINSRAAAMPDSSEVNWLLLLLCLLLQCCDALCWPVWCQQEAG